jgi:hypothetical protein
MANLYKCRWQVEWFFRWIKQHLRIKAFFGISENAVKFGRQFVFICSSPSSENGLSRLYYEAHAFRKKPGFSALFQDHPMQNSPQAISNQSNLFD